MVEAWDFMELNMPTKMFQIFLQQSTSTHSYMLLPLDVKLPTNGFQGFWMCIYTTLFHGQMTNHKSFLAQPPLKYQIFLFGSTILIFEHNVHNIRKFSKLIAKDIDMFAKWNVYNQQVNHAFGPYTRNWEI